MIVVAKYKKKMIGHFAAIEIEYVLKNFFLSGSHSIGLMVAKKWQSRGISALLFNKLTDIIKKKKLNFIYGLPNNRAFSLHKNIFNYNIQKSLNHFFYRVKKKKPTDKRFIFKNIKKIGKEHDSFFIKNLSRYPFFLKRDSKFLNKRYLSRPDHKYFIYNIYLNNELKGYCVLKIYQDKNLRRGHILDFFTIDDLNVKKNLLNFIVNFFNEKKISLIDTYFIGDTKLENLFLSEGFVVKKKINLLCKTYNKNLAKQLTKKNFWFFIQGDSFEIY